MKYKKAKFTPCRAMRRTTNPVSTVSTLLLWWRRLAGADKKRHKVTKNEVSDHFPLRFRL